MAEKENHLHEFFDSINVITSGAHHMKGLADSAKTLGLTYLANRLYEIAEANEVAVKTMQDAYTLDTKRYGL